MPLVDAPLGDVSAKQGKVRSHLFPAANTALPFVRGDERTLKEIAEFRKNRLRVDVFAAKVVRGDAESAFPAPDHRGVVLGAGELVEFQVVVRNRDVGHAFPGGTLDSNEAWVRFAAYDAERPDVPLFESGAIDPATHVVDRDAHFYRAVFVNEESLEADRRNPHDFRATAHVKTIGPGTADVVRYAFRVPERLAGRRLTVRAAVSWRKFRRNYVEFAWGRVFPGRAVPEIPVDELAAGEATFVVAGAAVPSPTPLEAARVATEWMRWNDWGIGLLLQGDTRGAEKAFRAVAEAAPSRVDGWRNLARVALEEGNPSLALEMMQKAEEVKPGDPQNAYFFSLAREKLGQLDEAVAALERARQVFPDDRTIHQRLGQIRRRIGDALEAPENLSYYEQALRDNLRALAIDPEDRTAHYQRMLLYRKLGDEHAAREAEKAYRKYQIDESAQKWTAEYRRENPAVNFESQSIHVHELKERAR
jgi:tetratricopeptide (TPR) repeat protein